MPPRRLVVGGCSAAGTNGPLDCAPYTNFGATQTQIYSDPVTTLFYFILNFATNYPVILPKSQYRGNITSASNIQKRHSCLTIGFDPNTAHTTSNQFRPIVTALSPLQIDYDTDPPPHTGRACGEYHYPDTPTNDTVNNYARYLTTDNCVIKNLCDSVTTCVTVDTTALCRKNEMPYNGPRCTYPWQSLQSSNRFEGIFVPPAPSGQMW